MYEELARKGISVGDRIEVDGIKGILMPKPETSGKDILIIKLDNGYNIGISKEKVKEIKLIEKGKPIELKHAKISLEHDASKPTVSILACGGTIASRIEYQTGAVYPAFSPEDLVSTFPEVGKIANIESRKLFDLFSEDMQPKHWQIIAEEVAKEIEKGVDGIVLMHGTDTMHYTAAALSFMLQDLPVPVVLVGAQRSSDRPSSDNQVNLVSSVLVAANSDIAEVCVCMHALPSDEYCLVHQGTKVRKMHTSRRDAFQSVNAKPFARVSYFEKKIEYLRNDYHKRDKNRKLKLDTKIDENVGIFYFHPGAKPEALKAMAKFYNGIVIAATGLGHVGINPIKDKYAKEFLPVIKQLIDSGIPVVFAPQTIFGRLNLNVYLTGRLLKQAGVIGDGCDWTLETATVKLMWVLGHTKNMEKIREMMLTNYVGEISERTTIEEEV